MKQTFKFTRYIVVLVMVGLMLGANLPLAGASKNSTVRMVPQNFSALADNVSPAVVHIRVEKTIKVGGSSFQRFGQLAGIAGKSAGVRRTQRHMAVPVTAAEVFIKKRVGHKTIDF